MMRHERIQKNDHLLARKSDHGISIKQTALDVRFRSFHRTVENQRQAMTVTSNSEGKSFPSIVMVAGTSSGVGKTTLACGIMAALTRRGLNVAPFKVGPDFLDAMHHEAAIEAARCDWKKKVCSASEQKQKRSLGRRRKTINLDGWMMGGEQAVLDCFLRHSGKDDDLVDVCVVEGCMGLYDSKNGKSDDGSSAQIAKYVNASVVLVVDAGKMARSVAPMALGYATFDREVHVDAVIANKVGGKNHVQWIQEAVEDLNSRADLTSKLVFAGGMVRDQTVTIPERHLGLTMPNEEMNKETTHDRLLRLADLVEEHVHLDQILESGRQRGLELFKRLSSMTPLPTFSNTLSKAKETICRIGVALDEAFCFYYSDNLSLLESMGAEIVPFSPLNDNGLPRNIDGLYLGGGYPELFADGLKANESMRKDILSFAKAGGLIYAECGGMMYLTGCLYTGSDENQQQSKMCGIFPDAISRMTSRMKMHYAEVEFTPDNPIFSPGEKCRGQKFHFSETIFVDEETTNSDKKSQERKFPLKATPETVKDVQPELVGLTYKNVVASYYHLHFASNTAIASEFTRKVFECSPSRHHSAISFVSAATEIVFAMGAESKLGGVTSLCDYPPEARYAPRRTVCRSMINASEMTSEEVDAAMKAIRERSDVNGTGPGLWMTDDNCIKTLSPEVVFVQSSCDICDPRQDDVMMALHRTGFLGDTKKPEDVKVVEVSPTTLEGVFASIERVAEALGLPQKGVNLCKNLRERLLAVQTALSKQGETTKEPSVLSLEGLSPLCTGGNWLPDIKHLAGCQDAFGEKGGANARVVTWDEILSVDPDVLVLSPCSSAPARTLNELHHLSSQPSFWKLRCVQNGEVYIIDHNRFSRPGPRLVSGVEMLASLLRGIPPPPGAKTEWATEVLKYNVNLSNRDTNADSTATICATDLASCFEFPFTETPNTLE